MSYYREYFVGKENLFTELIILRCNVRRYGETRHE